MYMLKLFFMTALANLPFGLFIGGICFLFFKVLLMFKHPVIATIAKLALGLASFAVIIGFLYGSLRFGGVITFPTDNTISWNFFDASWRDDGFGYIYICVSALTGFALAVRAEWNARRSEA